MNWPSLILVNGPSSAGKTTTSRYYRGADTKEQSETDALTALGVEMVQTSPPGAPISVTARFGPVFRRIQDAMAPAVRTLIDHGNLVIFDHVMHDRAMYESFLDATAGLDVFTVGVICPIDVPEIRKRARGDRVLGRARGDWRKSRTASAAMMWWSTPVQ